MKVDSKEQMEDLVEMFDSQQPLLLQELVKSSYGKASVVFCSLAALAISVQHAEFCFRKLFCVQLEIDVHSCS